MTYALVIPIEPHEVDKVRRGLDEADFCDWLEVRGVGLNTDDGEGPLIFNGGNNATVEEVPA